MAETAPTRPVQLYVCDRGHVTPERTRCAECLPPPSIPAAPAPERDFAQGLAVGAVLAGIAALLAVTLIVLHLA